MTKAQEELEEGKKAVKKTESKRETFEEKVESLEFDEVLLTGCGSSYKVSMMTASEMRKSGLKARAVEASEIIFSDQVIGENCLVIGFSQSGETSETIKALKAAKNGGSQTLAVLNSENSTMSDAADISLITPAGEEKAVLATKSVDSALRTGLVLKEIFAEEETKPVNIGESVDKNISEAVEMLKDEDKAYCLGIGSFKGLAGEAATKLGEGPLIHANYMTSLEFSHGPKSNAEHIPVIVLALQPELEGVYKEFFKEVKDSGAKTIVLSPETANYKDETDLEIKVKNGLFPSLKIIQRLAVETALEKGLNPDSPPNLSKHVEKEKLD